MKNLSIINANGDTSSRYLDSFGFSMHLQQVEFYSESTSYNVNRVVDIRPNGLSGDPVNLIENIHMHNIEVTNNGLLISSSAGASTTSNVVKNSTFNDIAFTDSALMIGFAGFQGDNAVSGIVENNTIQDIEFSSNGIVISSQGFATTGDNTVSLIVRNNTIRYTPGANTAFVAGIGVIPIALTGRTATVSLDMQNNLIVLPSNGSNLACINVPQGLGGTENGTLTSLGGNLSNVSACSDMSESTDHGDVTNANTYLGTLQNNGGSTPTIALLSGSSAIDAGVSNSLAVDQRGVARPQGSAFDIGAFELAATTQTEEESTGSTGLASTGTNVVITFVTSIALVILGVCSFVYYNNIVDKSR